MKNIEFLKPNTIQSIYNSIIEYIYAYDKPKGDNGVKRIGKKLYTIKFSDLTSWNIDVLLRTKLSYFEDIGYRQLSKNERPTMTMLANKVCHMLYNLHDPNSVYRMLYSCAYKSPKKLHLQPNNDDNPYGVFYDGDATDEREQNQIFPDGKVIYKNVKQPKGHFRLGIGIYTLTEDEQKYLQKLFE